MKIIDDQIHKQKNKFKSLQDGLNVSITDSNISFSFDLKESIKNGLDILDKYYKNYMNKMRKRIFKYLIRNAKKKEYKI